LEGLQDALDIPRYHHERWDGQGYPEKLKGEEIPLAARIFSLIDVYDALQSRRPYKEAIQETDVLEMIRNERGKHFDPDITDHFLENFNSIKEEAAHGYKKNNSCD
jgi:HD-GYP domain-containing protein (c-di-GMP phosphodiesterase class II)